MNNFTYRSNEEKDNLEAILKQRKRKFNVQQWIARFIIACIVGALLYYIADHVLYTDIDGYVHVDANRVRAPFDMYLDSVYVSTGEFVNPGDTLYSYYVLNFLIERSDPYNEPAVMANQRSLKLKYQSTAGAIEVAKTNVMSLTQEIAEEDRNISFGLSTASHKMDLERQLKEENTRLSSLYNELDLLSSMLKRAEASMESISMNVSSPMIFDDVNSEALRSIVRYRICSDSSLITSITAPNKMILFSKEDILTMQHLDLDGNNLCIMSYVPIEKMHNVYDGTKAEVIVDNEHSFAATVYAVGLHATEIPENLRNYFAKKTTSLMAELRLDSGQEVPFWCLASGLPVTVRIKNYDAWQTKNLEESRLRYVTGSSKYNFKAE